ncbi:hypothetical protein [Kaistia granuli]|uniref:hypothetical protein n=1 Tax=Kaistia granuli TaxID=363259 RepID=UPI00035EF881|nr:hypothetical protein [Kaistia granuli]
MKTLRLVPTIDGTTTTITASQDGEPERSVFYQFDGALTPDASGIGNAALVAFLPYAMQRGLDIQVESEVDEDLLAQLEEVQDAWSRWHPGLFRRVGLDVAGVRPAMLPATRTAVAAFSGGLDSIFAVHAHKRDLLGYRKLDVRSGVLIQGFDLPLDQPVWFEDARRRASLMLTSYGLSLTTVRTNWRTLGAPWELGYIFGVASVLHQLKGRVGQAIIASDNAYGGDMPGWGSNAASNQMMSGPSFPLHFTGGGWSRTEKAAALTGEAAVLENLRVCWERPESLGNCGRCEKCIRTKLNFMANGVGHVPALGIPVTPRSIRGVLIRNAPVLELYRDLASEPWPGRPGIKAALESLVKRGVRRQSGWESRLLKYQRSLRKRGLWPR